MSWKCLCLLLITAEAVPDERSIMLWLQNDPATPNVAAVWKEQIANISEHRRNLTAVSPVIYGISPSGTFAGQGWHDIFLPDLPTFHAMGLQVVPLIGNKQGIGAMAHLLSKQGSENFIKAAVAEAVKRGYAGYNMDSELRGSYDPKSWDYLKPYTSRYMDFLNSFADALHAENMTLSVDIAACCGWKDTVNPKMPAGHCQGAFADFEFHATTCPMYQQSRLDTVFGMGTYSDSLFNSSSPYDPNLLKAMASAASRAIGVSKYGLGFKSGWFPSDTELEDAEETVRYLRDTLKVNQLAHWANTYGLTQTVWDLWGFFLHVDGNAEETVLV